ncbi:LysR substrate-binding domain-containing protein, partial [Streptomyces sp. NPDC057674]
VLPPGHPLAAGERVALGDLAKDAWIGQSAGNPCHDVTVLACEYAGFTLNPEHSSDDFRAVVALAAASAGVALVPRSALRGMELTGVEVRPIEGVAPTRRVFAAVRRGAEDHPLISPVLTALGVASESGA